MKKTLLSLVIAQTFITPLAFADVTTQSGGTLVIAGDISSTTCVLQINNTNATQSGTVTVTVPTVTTAAFPGKAGAPATGGIANFTVVGSNCSCAIAPTNIVQLSFKYSGSAQTTEGLNEHQYPIDNTSIAKGAAVTLASTGSDAVNFTRDGTYAGKFVFSQQGKDGPCNFSVPMAAAITQIADELPTQGTYTTTTTANVQYQ